MDCEWQKRLIVSSDSATDRRNLRMLRSPRIRRKENSARASRSPVRRARVTSRYSLCLSSDFTSSRTGDCRSASASASEFKVSLQNGFFRYITFSQCIFLFFGFLEREMGVGNRNWLCRYRVAFFILLLETRRIFRN